MGFWRENMPADMLLRSDSTWHVDAAGVDTFEAFLEARALRIEDVDPIPLALLLEYTDWFTERKKLAPRADLVAELTHEGGRFVAKLESGRRITAEKVVATPGFRHFANLPEWAKGLPPGRATHTFDTVRFDRFAGRRVLIVGGRQSAYEWAALIGEAGAERIDIAQRKRIDELFRALDHAGADPCRGSGGTQK
jgi:cation diffusion facilitator CzcD-associated flavoprotein CzcO